ncbi:MAG TPA: hypothetical protein VJC06_00915 [Candidatus Paceibacterota bacterium]
MNKKLKNKELFEEMTEDDLDDCDCLMCQATKFNMRFGRYPSPVELAKFLKEERGRC